MARRKNVKRIDPRYFLDETVNRNDDGSRLEEIFGFSKAEKLEKLWNPEHGGHGGDLAQHYVAKFLDKENISGDVYPEDVIEKAREIWLSSDPPHTGDGWTAAVVAAAKSAVQPEAERVHGNRAERRASDKAREAATAKERAAEARKRAAYEKERDAEIQKKIDRENREADLGTGGWQDVFDFSHQLEEGYMSNRMGGDTTQGHMSDMFNSDDPQYPGRPFVSAMGAALDFGSAEALNAVWAFKGDDGRVVAGWLRDGLIDIARADRGSGWQGDHEDANREAGYAFGQDRMVTSEYLAGKEISPRDIQGMDFDKVMKAIKFKPLKWDPDAYAERYDGLVRYERR
jgi:hypothetical protein